MTDVEVIDIGHRVSAFAANKSLYHVKVKAGEYPPVETLLIALFEAMKSYRAEAAALTGNSGSWTGRKCGDCKGYGERTSDMGEEVSCQSCGGTGDEWMTWKAQFDRLMGEVEKASRGK